MKSQLFFVFIKGIKKIIFNNFLKKYKNMKKICIKKIKKAIFTRQLNSISYVSKPFFIVFFGHILANFENFCDKLLFIFDCFL